MKPTYQLGMALIGTALFMAACAKADTTMNSKLQLFVDDYLIESISGVSLKLHSPVPREVAIEFDKPWESQISASSPEHKFGDFVTVFKDGPLYRMYYAADGGKPDVACYAQSTDGVNWTKPSLGLYDYQGSKDNNIIATGWGVTMFAPFKDANPAAPLSQRYKGFRAVGRDGLLGMVSTDAIRWQNIQDKPVITAGPFDTLNTVFWDTQQKQYVCYLRAFVNNIRHIRRATSRDFVTWSQAKVIDLGGAPVEHLYTNAIVPYFRAPHIYLSFPMRFVLERTLYPDFFGKVGVSDAVFMSSRDGVHWDRRFMEAFIRPGLDQDNWTARNICPAWGIVPTAKDEISIYYTEHYRHADARLRRATLRTDGFVSVHADYRGGEFVTKPLLLAEKLIINYSTSAVGFIRVEIQDTNGAAVPEYALNDCPEIFGDEVEHTVSWKSGSDLSALARRPVRLRFAMKDADLYSIRVGPVRTEADTGGR